MSPDRGTVGWDFGGAHLKAALLDADGCLQRVEQVATPLWQGLDRLDEAVTGLAKKWPLADSAHAVTMTGELVDLFESRASGVDAMASRIAGHLGDVRLFAGPQGFVGADKATEFAPLIASANWYATAAFLASRLPAALLLDVGSTTTDVLVVRDGHVDNAGYTDRERLASEELVYTGVVRTPVMAVVQRVPFAGQWQLVANEHFATMADIYRILGWLPDDSDMYPSADGRDKGRTASMRRLARMLGADFEDATPGEWQQLAGFVSDRQLDGMSTACQRQLSRGLSTDAPIVGAGSGRFVVKRLAARLGRTYIDIDDCLPKPLNGSLSAGVCAPAAAVALLAQGERVACA